MFVNLRSIRPGCFPWHPEPEEAALMAEGMRLLKRYYEKHFAEYDWASFTPEFIGGEAVVEMPTFSLKKGGKRHDSEHWDLAMEELRVSLEVPVEQVLSDELFVTRFKEFPVKPAMSWELGAVYLPRPIISNGKPWYPVTAFVVPRESERIEGSQVKPANASKVALIRNCLAATAEVYGYLPSELVVGSLLAQQTLQELAESRGIILTLAHSPDQMSSFNAAAHALLQGGFAMPEQEGLLEEFESALEGLAGEAPGPHATEKEQEEFLKKLATKHPGLVERLTSQLEQGEPSPSFIEEAKVVPVYVAPQSKERYVFRVDLKGIKPPLWRRISLPKDATFFDLHRAIQAAFGWFGYHLHSFDSVGNSMLGFVIDWQGADGEHFGWKSSIKETELCLSDIFGKGEKSVNYTYDFGDNWEHRVKLEKEIVSEAKEVSPFEVMKGKGGFPFEDCGGIWGLAAIIDGSHEDIDEFAPDRVKELQEGVFNLAMVFPRSVKEEMEMQIAMSES